PVEDRQFFEFYLREGLRIGWGEPVSRDETRPGNPTLLFQQPNPLGKGSLASKISDPGHLVSHRFVIHGKVHEMGI
ncbi:MAG: hypothetical protein ACXWKG_20775, partial [Limisphaerales bacterium]